MAPGLGVQCYYYYRGGEVETGVGGGGEGGESRGGPHRKLTPTLPDDAASVFARVSSLPIVRYFADLLIVFRLTLILVELMTSFPNPPTPPSATARTHVVTVAEKSWDRQLLNSRTHNRRRWTHVFPPGETEFHTMDTMPGPIWNSLCQPALLPLSIDFVPSPQVRLSYAGRARAIDEFFCGGTGCYSVFLFWLFMMSNTHDRDKHEQ